MSNARRLARTTTNLPPCVVQIHPNDSSVCLVGTYQLEEEGMRRGSLDVYRNYNNRLDFESSSETDSSILDVKICPHDPSLVFTAQSTGSIIAWKISVPAHSPSSNPSSPSSEEESVLGRSPASISSISSISSRSSRSSVSARASLPPVSLKKIDQFQLFPETTLVLAICFSPEDPTIMSATLSSGEVAMLKFANNGAPVITGLSHTHLLESWTSAIGSRSLSNVLFSGGDDSLLAAHDMRLMSETESGVIWTSVKLHDAGVTSILPSSKNWMSSNPNYLWTGGYDDHLRAIDLRTGPNNSLESYLPPTVSSSINLRGGVWRLTPSPKEGDDRVLACCMYEGARIVSPDRPATVQRVIRKGHESMVYGGDWTADGSQMITCSFYDKQLQLWSSQDKEEDYPRFEQESAYAQLNNESLRTQSLLSTPEISM
ncbi:diphthamide synthase [Sugiyamaella lignohabitans]|uniref:methylated diphthine methylhydrolase n=1 Tax=Sugiyamaella lignohabitans TaxID=796027 RepID=A0A167CEP9_9ASCO|nr:diphthamide synthase [Sugiyamaella lignohabitans]ANB11594.1 diphthamide synthase [Sugiyamaella lignohabitans]